MFSDVPVLQTLVLAIIPIFFLQGAVDLGAKALAKGVRDA